MKPGFANALFRPVAMFLALGASAAAHAASPLDGLEMDVLDVHETPARTSSRITLPQLSDEREHGARAAPTLELPGRLGIQSTRELPEFGKTPALAPETQAGSESRQVGSAPADTPAGSGEDARDTSPHAVAAEPAETAPAADAQASSPPAGEAPRAEAEPVNAQADAPESPPQPAKESP